MTSMDYSNQRLNKGKGPLKAYYLPSSTSTESISTTCRDMSNGNYFPKTYWTDSEDALSAISSFSDSSSASTISLPHLTLIKTPQQGLSGNGSLRHFPTLAGIKRSGSHLVNDTRDNEIECACCSSSTPTKRPHVAMGAGGLRALRGLYLTNQSSLTALSTSSSSQYLAPVCSVPMLPPCLSRSSIQKYAAPDVRSIETQTSPLEDDKRKTRRSSGALLTSFKKKIHNFRRSMSFDKLTVQRSRDETSLSTPKRHCEEQSGVTKCTLLQSFADGSRVVQLKRRSTTDQFGLFIKVDSKGLFVSRLGKIEFTSGGRTCLRVGDRVLEVQNIPAKDLDTETVRGLLQGCQIARLKVKSTSR